MTLRERQSLFCRLLGRLLVYADWRGYEFTAGDAWRPDRQGHMANSLHYDRLAMDLNLFVDGEYITDGGHPAYKDLGEFWESLHPEARWGGRFHDANHFSVTWRGRA